MEGALDEKIISNGTNNSQPKIFGSLCSERSVQLHSIISLKLYSFNVISCFDATDLALG